MNTLGVDLSQAHGGEVYLDNLVAFRHAAHRDAVMVETNDAHLHLRLPKYRPRA